MSKSIWIALVCGTISIVAALWFMMSWPTLQKEIPLPPWPKSADIKMPTITPEDQKFIDDMKKSEWAAEKKKEATIAGIELFNQAAKNQDVSLCEKIEIEEMHQNCTNQITSALASAKKDPLICDSLSGSSSDGCRDTVYFSSAMTQVSLSWNESEWCEKIIDASLRNTCKKKTESVTLEMKQSSKWELSEKDCKGFEDSIVQWDCRSRVSVQNDYKILSEASKNPSPWLCNKIQDESLKAKCNDTSLFFQAKKENNLSFCEDMTDPSFIDQCKKDIVQIQERWIFLEALNTDDPKLCEKLAQGSLKTSCLDRTRIKRIIESKNSSQCDILIDESLRSSCVQSITLQS